MLRLDEADLFSELSCKQTAIRLYTCISFANTVSKEEVHCREALTQFHLKIHSRLPPPNPRRVRARSFRFELVYQPLPPPNPVSFLVQRTKNASWTCLRNKFSLHQHHEVLAPMLREAIPLPIQFLLEFRSIRVPNSPKRIETFHQKMPVVDDAVLRVVDLWGYRQRVIVSDDVFVSGARRAADATRHLFHLMVVRPVACLSISSCKYVVLCSV